MRKQHGIATTVPMQKLFAALNLHLLFRGLCIAMCFLAAVDITGCRNRFPCSRLMHRYVKFSNNACIRSVNWTLQMYTLCGQIRNWSCLAADSFTAQNLEDNSTLSPHSPYTDYPACCMEFSSAGAHSQLRAPTCQGQSLSPTNTRHDLNYQEARGWQHSAGNTKHKTSGLGTTSLPHAHATGFSSAHTPASA